MNLPSVIYVCGYDFSQPHSGLQNRLRNVSEYLGERYREHPRFLLSRVRPLPAEQLAKTGWQWVPVRSSILLPKWRRGIHAGKTTLVWRWFKQRPAEMLSIVGGSALRFTAVEESFFSSHMGALVLVGRCCLAGMVQFRRPGQRWALDSNDSLTNLESAYKDADRWRRLACATRKSWLARLQSVEQTFARQYDRIISFSEDDDRFFADVVPGKVILEDTCIVLPSHLPSLCAKYDVGFIGGSCQGSVKSAGNLINLAAMPKMAQLRIGIAGRVCGELAHHPLTANVELVGTVADSLAFLRQCKCVVIFTDQETGTSVKFQEALAAGCIVIANKNGARFSQAKAGETHLEVKTIDEVAQLLLSGAVWRFIPGNFQAQFSRTAFHQRLATALDWPIFHDI